MCRSPVIVPSDRNSPSKIDNSVRSGAISPGTNVDCRDQATWKFIAAKRVHFPFDDDSLLAQAGVPETCEYQAIGVQGDKEFGQPGDIVSVLYGGA